MEENKVNYEFSKETKETRICELKTKTDIIRYEYYRKGSGWEINRDWHNIDSGVFSREESLFIPDEVIEDIISSLAQNKLSE